MRKLFVMLLLSLMLCLTAASAQNMEILGQPFPDFTVTDTEGEAFTLSKALEDHEAVLINIWATWCPPCQREFPFLNEAYEKYGDRVAFIALSSEAKDTQEIIAQFRESHGVTFPMGSDTETDLAAYVQAAAIPTTVVVDRFGNAAFMHSGMFMNAEEVERVLEACLGESYTETRVLTEIPKNSGTRAFPVAADRHVIVENPSAQRIIVSWQGADTEMTVYVINDDVAHLRLELEAEADPEDTIYYDYGTETPLMMPGLLEDDGSAYRYDQALPTAGAPYHYTAGVLAGYSESSERDIMVYLIPSEDYIQEFIDAFREQGYELTWEYADDKPAAGEAAAAYTLMVVDQNGAPVPGAAVNFCTDTTCTTTKSDADGVIVFDGPAMAYHVVLLKVPEGYSFDADFDMYTPETYGTWLLRVKKD